MFIVIFMSIGGDNDPNLSGDGPRFTPSLAFLFNLDHNITKESTYSIKLHQSIHYMDQSCEKHKSLTYQCIGSIE
jgi:hypothetical protein